ncbi:MAG: RNAase [Lachnospiraceae bacterium]|nr:RNAase [Lachnospiraceae bacterium]
MEENIKDPENLNVVYLAYIGDAIFDLFTRDLLIKNHISKVKMNELHKMNTDIVCAKSQARIIERLIDDNVLSDEEIDFYRHARNAHPHSKSKNSSIVDYRKATGFEALLGLLYYREDKNRLDTLLDKVKGYLLK